MTKKTIALFVGSGAIGNMAINKAVPLIVQMGYQPILFQTQEPRLERAGISALQESRFYETTLLQEAVATAEENVEPPMHNGSAVPGLCYTNKQLAKIYKLDFEIVANVNDPVFLGRMLSDASIIGAYSIRNYQVFHELFLEIFKSKQNGFAWNMHSGLLPQYKGVYIPYHAIENNEKVYGWTLHDIDRKIDTGPILALDWRELDPAASIMSTYLDMIPKGTQMLKDVLTQYKRDGKVERKIQPRFMSDSYYTFPTAQQMEQHKKNGVIYATDKEAVDIYMRSYTVAGTHHAAELERLLWEAIGQHHNAASSIQRA